MIAVGIDIGKRSHQACFLDEAGRQVRPPLRFANSRTGLETLVSHLQTLPQPAIIGLEASGHYWLPLQRRLNSLGFKVVVINPLQTSSLRNLAVRKLKNDRQDATTVADLVRIGRVKENYVPDDTILKLRELTRFRWTLVDQIGDAKRRILKVLDRVFPEFADRFSDPFGATARELLKRAAAAQEFAALDLAELTALLEQASRRRLGRACAEALKRSAADSLGLDALGEVARLEIRALLAQVELLEAQVAEIDRQIAGLMSSMEQQLTTIPGLGPVLAATVLAEIGDPARFASFKALVAYAGLDPSVFASGQFEGRRRLSKRGSPYLRRALYLGAHSARLYNPDLDAYFKRKLAEGRSYKEAVVATSRKLLARIYVILKENRPFRVESPSHDH